MEQDQYSEQHQKTEDPHDIPEKSKTKWWIIGGILVVGIVVIVWLTTRGEDETNTNVELPEVSRVPEGQALKLSFLNHVVLDEGHYEAWVVLDGVQTSVQKFNIREDGKLVTVDGEVIQFSELDAGRDISDAEEVIITIEPADDADEGPSPVEFLRGSIDATTKTGVLRYPGAEFTNISGRYVIGTPTNGPNTDENSGIAFLTAPAAAGSPQTKGLTLPALPTGWVYEGWVTVQGKNLSTGRFTNPEAPDGSSVYSGTAASGPAFPAEDFLRNAPIDLGLTFPIDLTDGTTQASITIEPDIGGKDITGPARFDQPVLFGFIPEGAVPDVNYDLSDATGEFTTATAALR